MKKSKIMMSVLLSAMTFGLLAGVFAGQKNNDKVEMVKAEPATATFSGLAGAWNPQTYGGSVARYILTFSEELGENNGVDFTSDIGDHFQLNGVSLKTLRESDANVLIGHNNQGANNLFIRFDVSHIVATEDYPTPIFHIDEGTPFQNYLLPELTFAVDTSSYAMTEVVELTYSSLKNNEDYSSPHPSGITYSGAAPSNGAMLGVVFNENGFGHAGTDVEDHTSTWGKNIYVNGTKLSDVDGAVVGVYVNRLYIFVPTAYLTFVNPASNTIHSTVYVKRALYGNCIIPTMNFFWNGTVGSVGGWVMQTGPNDATFSQIRWNNTDNGNYGGHKGILLEYTSNLAQRGDYFNAGLDKVNLINYGALDAGTKIKLNGVPLKDIDGAEVYYKMTTMLWIYAPEMGTKGNVLEIQNAQVMDSYLPTQYFLFDTSWSVVAEDVFGNVSTFVDTYMHMDANVNGQCVSYYPLAKGAYASLSANAKMVFTNNAAFEDAFDRLVKWATYHSETFDGSTFTANQNGLLFIGDVDSSSNSDMFVVAIVSSVVVLSMLAAFFTLKRKRKEY